jgi:hypothetical protein
VQNPSNPDQNKTEKKGEEAKESTSASQSFINRG